MKNILSVLLFTFLILGCTCDENEVLRDEVNDANAQYFTSIQETKRYQDANGVIRDMHVQPAFTYMRKLFVGDSCDYWNIQNVEQNFTMGDWTASTHLAARVFAVRILIPGGSMSYQLEFSDSERLLDNYLQNVEIDDFVFENVLVLLPQAHIIPEIDGIEKIIYSKEKGIELFYFRNGNYLKLLD